MTRLGVFLLRLDGIPVHRRSLPCNLLIKNSPVPIYRPRWREALWELRILPKNTTQCPWPGLEPRPLHPETSAALTKRPPRLPPSGKMRAINLSTCVTSWNSDWKWDLLLWRYLLSGFLRKDFREYTRPFVSRHLLFLWNKTLPKERERFVVITLITKNDHTGYLITTMTYVHGPFLPEERKN